MKIRYISVGIAAIISIIAAFSFIVPRQDTNQNNNNEIKKQRKASKDGKLLKIDLPHNVKKIQTGLYHSKMNKTLFSGGSDRITGVWSYTPKTGFENLLQIERKFHNGFLFASPNGDIYFSINNPKRTYRSTDQGKSWKKVNNVIFWGMVFRNNKVYGTFWSSNKPILFRSKDNGKNWNVWKNFSKIFPEQRETYDYNNSQNWSKLRHLHDIVALEDRIILGTGDMTRWTLETTDHGKVGIRYGTKASQNIFMIKTKIIFIYLLTGSKMKCMVLNDMI